MRSSIAIGAAGALLALLTASPGLANSLTGRQIVEKFDNSNRAEDEVVEVDDPDQLLGSEADEGVDHVRQERGDLRKRPLADPVPLASIIRDTGFLTIEEDGRNKQWIFIPDLRRSKKIAGSSRAGSFVESDLRNYDVATESLVEHNYKLLGEQEQQGRTCYRVLATPKDEDIMDTCGYSKRILYIDKERFTLVKTEYFDRSGKPLKIATNSGWRKVEGRWRFDQLLVENTQEGSKTIMKFKPQTRKMDQGLSNSYFSKRKLEKP